MSEYKITVKTTRPLGTMDVLLDAIEQEMENQGFCHGEWEAEVHGPAELRIGLVPR